MYIFLISSTVIVELGEEEELCFENNVFANHSTFKVFSIFKTYN